jgi:hypothetical protein
VVGVELGELRQPGEGGVAVRALAEPVVGDVLAALAVGLRVLEPRVLVGGVVEHEVVDHLQPARVGVGDEAAELVDVPNRGSTSVRSVGW